MGLRLRLILTLVIPLVLVVGVYGLVRIREEQAQLLDEDRRNMALTTKAIQIAVENALRDRQISDIKRLLFEIVEDQEQIDRIRLFDRKLAATLVSNPLSIGEEIPGEPLRRVIETGQPQGFYQRRGKQPVLYYLVPLRGRRGEIQGAMEVVHLAAGVERRVQAATRDVWLRLGVLLVVVATLTGFMLQRQVLRPLSGLAEGIRSLGQGQRGPPLPVERRDELGRVAEAFNRMAEQLEAARGRLLAETERTLDLEQQVRQAETLAVAGKLASGIAHEVGTPLNIISGRAEFLLKSLPQDDPRRPDLEVIIAQIDRISGIIRSLLDMVRPRKPEVQPIALAPVLERLLPLLAHAARRRGVALTAAVPQDLPPMLADPNQLQQVLINLLMNALEATPAGGRVGVSANRVSRDGRAGVTVAVSDTGSGIPVDLLSQVFEPFFTTKPSGQGTGLGLSICRDIVREHGGEIRVESRPDEGTTFTVWLPAEAGQP
ncbi:MAG: HAMP domain-containing protein [Candidatus Rokubacteria bacterium]|nr:HAMP domain-containing protein [Candidatus Rokubacteria bacterium]